MKRVLVFRLRDSFGAEFTLSEANVRLAMTLFGCSLFIFLALYPVVSFAAENRDGAEHYPTPEEIQRAARPILPPTVPSSVYAPTPSPLISTPSIPHMVISAPLHPVGPPSPTHNIHNVPSMPMRVMLPNVPVTLALPEIAVIGNTIGRVMDKGTEGGAAWLEVKDQLFNEVIHVKIENLKSTPIVGQGRIKRFQDIQIGKYVNVLYMSKGNENIANFISIMTEEDLALIQSAPPTQEETQPISVEEDSTGIGIILGE